MFELISAFGALFLCLLLFNFIAGASNKIHYKLLHSVMRSPMSFFDTNPTGRIINRFTTDIDTIDDQIPHSLLDFFWCVMSVIGKYLPQMYAYSVSSLFQFYFTAPLEKMPYTLPFTKIFHFCSKVFNESLRPFLNLVQAVLK